MNGTQRKHGMTVGFIVVGSRIGAASLCHGYNDPRLRVLLGQPPGDVHQRIAYLAEISAVGHPRRKPRPRPRKRGGQ